MAAMITPEIGLTGYYTVKAPFKLDLNDVYRCESIRSLKELNDHFNFPYLEYYLLAGATMAQYEADKAAGAAMVALLSSGGSYTWVPNTYITSIPGQSPLDYERKCLMLDLGPLPKSYDLEFVKDEIYDILLTRVGIDEERAKIVEAVVPSKTGISQEEHVQLEKSRIANIKNHTSMLSMISNLTSSITDASKTINNLVDTIADHEDLFDVSDDLSDAAGDLIDIGK